jgi:hypothetical protein
MIYALPDSPYTSVLNAGIEGLVGTLKVQLERGDGTTAVAATTAGIVEIEPKIYAKTDNLAPTTKGTYVVVWTGPEGQRAAEELVVTTTLPEEGSDVGWAPTVDAVAALIRARTKVPGGAEAGTFTENTRVTRAEAERIIAQAVEHVSAAIGGEPCNEELRKSASAASAMLAAVIIETSYWPESAEARGSSAARLESLFNARMKSLTAAVAEECGGQGTGGTENGNSGAVAAGSFSDGLVLIGRDYPPRW